MEFLARRKLLAIGALLVVVGIYLAVKRGTKKEG